MPEPNLTVPCSRLGVCALVDQAGAWRPKHKQVAPFSNRACTTCGYALLIASNPGWVERLMARTFDSGA